MFDLRLRTKLILIQLVTAAVMLLVFAGSLLVYEVQEGRQQTAARLQTTAAIVGENTLPTLDFLDRASARQVLRSLDADPAFRHAVLYDAQGNLFAEHYGRGRAKVDVPLEAPGFRLDDNEARVFHRILRDKRVVGTLFLAYDVTSLQQGFQRARSRILATGGLGMSLAVLLALALQAPITGAIERLTAGARRVSREQNYTVRIPANSGDELGQLTDEFNSMIGTVGTATDALAEHAEQLERRVRERTAMLEESESRLRAILDGMIDALIICSHEGQILQANPSSGALFGCTPDSLLGRNLDNLVTTPDALDSWIGHLIEATATRIDGTTVRVEMTAGLVHAGTLGTTFAIALRDLSEREQLERMQQNFVSTVSHELRTPVTSIFGSLRLFGSGAIDPNSETGEHMLQVAIRNCERLIRLVDQLLDMQKLQSRMADLRFEATDLVELLEEVVDASSGYATRFDASVVLAGDLSEPLVATLDAEAFSRAVQNLLSNAIKHHRGEEPVIIELSRRGKTARVSVKDRGAGIPREFRDRIFQRFQQASHGNTRQVGGTGLGLAIARAIVDKHDGSIGFLDRDGGGTVFWLQIPREGPKT